MTGVSRNIVNGDRLMKLRSCQKRPAVSSGYWSVRSNQIKFIRNLEEKFNIQEKEDWYKITARNIKSAGGGTLLFRYYANSPTKMIKNLVSNHEWDTTRFKSVPKHYWNNEANQIEFMNVLKERLNVKEWEDWYKITSKDLIDAGTFGCIFQLISV